jgi:hypothetical protein
MSLSELADSQLKLVSSGVSASDSLKMLAVADKAAKSRLTDTATVITGLTSVMKSYGLEANAATRISGNVLKSLYRTR